MRKFACGPTSFPNAAAGLRCRVTRIRIGSKPGANSSPNQVRAKSGLTPTAFSQEEFLTNGRRDCRFKEWRSPVRRIQRDGRSQRGFARTRRDHWRRRESSRRTGAHGAIERRFRKDRQTASGTATPHQSAAGALSSAPQLRQSARIPGTTVAAFVTLFEKTRARTGTGR